MWTLFISIFFLRTFLLR